MTALQLNEAQRQAVMHGEGPCLVIAGAGSGKTRVLTERIRRLVGEGVPPWRILGFTFTNKAAGEMRRRLEETLGEVARRLWLGTFHATGVRILRREAEAAGIERDFVIYDADDQQTLLKRIIKELALTEASITPQAARAHIEDLKQALVAPKQAAAQAEGFRDAQMARVYEAYQKELRRAQALDFTDLIALPVKLFNEDGALRGRWSGRFDYVLVDEFQDSNPLQMRFIEHLASASGNLFVVGDDDQSIYGWRGADLRHILDFETRFPGTQLIRLEQNFRSTRPILEVANAVIAHNRRRKGKELWTAKEAGQPVRVLTVLDEEEEAESIARRVKSQRALGEALSGFGVLYRTHAQSRSLEAAFGQHRLPYQIVGGTRFYDRREIRDLLAYLKVIANPSDTVSFLRILNVPPRGIGQSTLARLMDLAERQGMPPGLLITAFSDRLDELPESAAARLRDFGRLLLVLCRRPAEEAAPDVLERLLERVPYLDYLAESDPVQAQARQENVRELVNATQAFFEQRLAESQAGARQEDAVPGQPGSLRDFLADVALVADVDALGDDKETVTLMTLHNAKGLEFDTVFLCGVEEQLLPHAMSSDDEAEVEEERRLFYVGVTRARTRLWILHALNRRRYGDTLACMPSRFLAELPAAWIEREGEALLAQSDSGYWNARAARPGRERASESYEPAWRSRDRRGMLSLDPRRAPADRRAGWTVDDDFNQAQGGDFAAEFNQEESLLKVGMRVRHPSLGEGTVHRLEGGGSELRVIVLFDKKGARKLLARAAGLVRV